MSSVVDFVDYPSEAKTWIFAAQDLIPTSTLAALQQEIEAFLSSWQAHGKPVRAGFAVPYSRFLVIAADPATSEVSGCSIDAMFRSVEEICTKLGIQIASPRTIFYRSGDAIVAEDRESFESRCKNGEIEASTIVFNPAVSTLGDIRGDRFELPFEKSWHAKLFSL